MHSARRSGKWKFISAGASVPGVIWKTIRTPSIVSSCPVRVTSLVGAIRPTEPDRRRDPQAGADLTGGAAVQDRAVHVGRAAVHRDPGVDVLRHRVLQEPLRGQDRHTPAALGQHPVHPAEVVGMRMGVDHPGHRPVSAVLAVQRDARRRGLGRDQRVDHDHPGVALDDRHVREVHPADLVDAAGHLEQAVLGAQLRLSPQARVHRVRALAVQVGIRLQVPHHPAIGGPYHAWIQCIDPPALGILEILPVLE